jgi:bifunctional DNA-binding transcriptional regulator/antitoxin component of YhaV-PrlF toxin-antitoxin module
MSVSTGMIFVSYYVDTKVGERGQVTIPKELRERFGLVPETELSSGS